MAINILYDPPPSPPLLSQPPFHLLGSLPAPTSSSCSASSSSGRNETRIDRNKNGTWIVALALLPEDVKMEELEDEEEMGTHRPVLEVNLLETLLQSEQQSPGNASYLSIATQRIGWFLSNSCSDFAMKCLNKSNWVISTKFLFRKFELVELVAIIRRLNDRFSHFDDRHYAAILQ